MEVSEAKQGDFTFDNRSFLFAPSAFDKERLHDINNVFNLAGLLNKYIKIYISTKYVHTERRGVIVDIVNLKEEIVKIHYDKHKMTEEICLKNADWTIDDPSLTNPRKNAYSKRNKRLLQKMRRMGRLTMLLQKRTLPQNQVRRKTTIGFIAEQSNSGHEPTSENHREQEMQQTEEDQNISRAGDETKRLEIVDYDKVENFLDTNNEDRMHRYLRNDSSSRNVERNYVMSQMINAESPQVSTGKIVYSPIPSMSKVEAQLIEKINRKAERHKETIDKSTGNFKTIYLRPDDIKPIK